jgi:pimeloyl-ACP methyl ester carboxylesterase
MGRRLAAAFGWLVAPLFLRRDWDPTDAVSTLRADLSLDLTDRLGDIRAPVLVICGDSDPSYPEALTAELACSIPLCQRIVYRRTGHGVILSRRFAADLAAFLL